MNAEVENTWWYDVVDGDEFARDLAAAAAKQLRKVSLREREDAIAFLQDQTSLYSPYTADEIERVLSEEQD